MAQVAVVLPRRDVGGFSLWGHERGRTVDLLGAGSARPTLTFFVSTGDNSVLVSSSSPPPLRIARGDVAALKEDAAFSSQLHKQGERMVTRWSISKFSPSFSSLGVSVQNVPPPSSSPPDKSLDAALWLSRMTHCRAYSTSPQQCGCFISLPVMRHKILCPIFFTL